MKNFKNFIWSGQCDSNIEMVTCRLLHVGTDKSNCCFKTKEGFNASKCIRKRRVEEREILEEGITSAEPDEIAGIDAQT